MKGLLLMVLVLGIFILVEWYFYNQPTTTEISVLRDETDKQLAEPSADAIFKRYGLFDNGEWRGGHFRYSSITDVSFNKTVEATVIPENFWMMNIIERGRDVERFRNIIFQTITASKQEAQTKSHSSVYIPIAKELNRLSQSKADTKVLVVYSDLMENEATLSFYNPKEFELLISNPDSVRKIFEGWQPLNSLSGIEVHLIYQPADPKADSEFRTVSEFYGKILESKGAKVMIEAALEN